MSNEDSNEKKHKPSQKRLEQLNKDGQFLRAKEFYSGLTLIVALTVLYVLSGSFYTTLTDNFFLIYSKFDVLTGEHWSLQELFYLLVQNNIKTLLPFFVAVLIAVFLSVNLLGGMHFSRKLIGFKAERLSINKNIKRIFSMQNAMELVKSIVKIVLFLIILMVFLYGHQTEILHLANISKANRVDHSMHLLAMYLIYLSLGILILVAIDGFYNYLQFQKKNKMTDQDLKDESKDSEGNPEIKKRQKQAQFSVAMQRLSQDIPKASVIITNPTHYAVALKYQDKVDAAPKIVAKGIDHMALHIKSLAKKHGVPVYEAPELARAIYHTGTVNHYILPELYMSVAIVLSYLFQLNNYQAGIGAEPEPVRDLKIPEGFKF